MLIFGGKLLIPKNVDVESDNVNNLRTHTVSLSHLSKKEKLILGDLQRTRLEIVNQLNRVDPTECNTTKDWIDVQHTLHDYERKLRTETFSTAPKNIEHDASNISRFFLPFVTSPRSKSHGPLSTDGFRTPVASRRSHKLQKLTEKKIFLSRSLSSLPQDICKNHSCQQVLLPIRIDMLPIMSNISGSALEVGLKKQGKLKLPIFTLPIIDFDKYNENGYIASDVVELEDCKYRSREEFLEAAMIMRNSLSHGEMVIIKNHLQLNDDCIKNIEEDIRYQLQLCNHRQTLYLNNSSLTQSWNGSSINSRRERTKSPEYTEGCVEGKSVSVFVRASQWSTFDPELIPDTSIDDSRNMTRNNNIYDCYDDNNNFFQRSHDDCISLMSTDMTSSILSQSMSNSRKDKYMKSVLKPSRHTTRKPDSHINSSSTSKNQKNPSLLLRVELKRSLTDMQIHTNMVINVFASTGLYECIERICNMIRYIMLWYCYV